MSLRTLHIHSVRNIKSMQLSLHPRYNFLYGLNGSGKTAILESIYLLSSGHSFRTRDILPLIQDGQASFTVFANTYSDGEISIQKSAKVSTQVRLNQQPCYRSSDLAYFLPSQVFCQDMFNIIDAGPSSRRTILDWGLFHVEPTYLSIWKDYRRVLKQRNTLLRQKASLEQCAPWNKLLVELSITLDKLRHEYFQGLSSEFAKILAQLTDVPCYISYYKGWGKNSVEKSLDELLIEQFSQDSLRQYTQSGAHQADIIFHTTPANAKQRLSRGQQKIILVALKLAQAKLLSKPCVYLFDDLVAELDTEHLQRLFAFFSQISGQFFFTSISLDKSWLSWLESESSIFEVSAGELS